MTMEEIPAGEWPAFLKQFGLDHRAWRTTVERFAAADPRVEVRDMPLVSVEPKTDRGRTTAIALRFQHDAVSESAVVIENPMRLRVEKTDEGAIHSLAIDTANGHATRITFRATQRPEALDGIAPGEL